MYCTESWIFLKCFLITECVASSQECREDPNVSPHTAFSLGEDEVVGEEGDCSIQRCQRAANSCWPHICCALSPGLFGDETQPWLTRGKPVIGASVLCRLWAQLGPTAGWVSPSVSMVSLQTRKSGALQKHLGPPLLMPWCYIMQIPALYLPLVGVHLPLSPRADTLCCDSFLSVMLLWITLPIGIWKLQGHLC